MSKFTKLMSLFFVLVMVVSCFAACGGKKDDNGPGKETDSTKIDEDVKAFRDRMEAKGKTDFGGAEINFIVCGGDEEMEDDSLNTRSITPFDTEDLSFAVNSAVVDRNNEVEKYLNVKIKLKAVSGMQALAGKITGPLSMGMHESQSRFYENMLGRSKEFWEPIFQKLKDTYREELSDVSLEDFIAGINKAEPGPIRTEADELTYPLHIMIRYELEKDLIAGKCSVSDLPELWNKKYQDYLGITPNDASEGVLPDIHWSGASFGYFPSYALGSAIAAQLYHYMTQQIPVTDYLKEGNLVPIREFLRDNIHKYGAVYPTNELLKKVTGEEFNPDYYIRYLTEKYTKLYHL